MINSTAARLICRVRQQQQHHHHHHLSLYHHSHHQYHTSLFTLTKLQPSSQQQQQQQEEPQQQQSNFFKILLSIKDKAETMGHQLKKERKVLVNNSHKLSSFREAQEFMWHEGKSLIGLRYLIPQHRAIVFPSCPRVCLSLSQDQNDLNSRSNTSRSNNKNGGNNESTTASDFEEQEHVDIAEYISKHKIKATMVTVSCTAFSAEMAKTWIEPFYKTFHTVMYETRMARTSPLHLYGDATFESDYCVKMFDISFGSSPFARFMRAALIKNMKKNTPEHLLDHSLACYPNSADQEMLDYFNAKLDMHNSKNCYVFLLDENAKVRWRGAGNATEEELLVLKRLTIQLVSPPKK